MVVIYSVSWEFVALFKGLASVVVLRVEENAGAYTMKSDLLVSQISFSLVRNNPGF